MIEDLHLFPGLFLLVLGLGCLLFVASRASDTYRKRAGVLLCGTFLAILLLLGYLLDFHRFTVHLPVAWVTWIKCAALVETLALCGLALASPVWGATPRFIPSRRLVLQAAGASLCAVPVAATAVAIAKPKRFRVSEVDIRIPNLPKDLEGLRIAQLTDIHLSAFLSEQEFARAIDMANEARAQVAVVTGDLITHRGDPLDACLRQLARLRAEGGVLGCLGNHERYALAEDYTAAQGRRLGIDFLRHENKLMRFGDAEINFAGVDYQRMHSAYLAGGERLLNPGALNVLLSHNPDVFPVAARQGYSLTLAGHTHGGQVNVEILHQNMNVARFYTPYVRGLYREGDASVYVSSGLGTIGVPIRIGAPAELSILRLCAT
jgi:predicted MPP superfamily phosphohydrolase